MTPRALSMPTLASIFGVDFSGGQAAARNTWIAELRSGDTRLILRSLRPLSAIVGEHADRPTALAGLSRLIAESRNAFWGMDFPFGLPVELNAMGRTWRRQLQFVAKWNGDARSFGRWCVEEALKHSGVMHIRRITDRQTKTPFDCYHYRIVYQTFHGMRDVLAPLASQSTTAILPFQYVRLPSAERVIVEACPASALKRWGLPHQNYKQPSARRIAPEKRRTRLAILAALESAVAINPAPRKLMLTNPGSDALDAVIAGLSTWQRFAELDHRAIRRHPRYPREGFVF